MDGLRPERDELDRFQARSSTPTTKKAAKQVAAEAPASAPAKGGLAVVVGLFGLTLVLFAFLGWAFIKQNNALSETDERLNEALDYINQTKLSMARFEGELSEAGAELEQSGSAASKKLKFLDSEMRKLWGLAGDKNKKAISQNKDSIASANLKVQKSSDKLRKQLSEVVAANKGLSKELSGIKRQLAAVSDVGVKVKAIEQQTATTASELSLTRESIEEEVALLARQVKSRPDSAAASKKNAKAVATNTQAIASIDASRSQLINRVLGLEGQIRSLKREMSASKAPSASQN